MRDNTWRPAGSPLLHLRADALAQELLLLGQQVRDLGRPPSHDAQLALEALVASIRQRVVPADGLGDTLDSLGELVLRASRVVILDTMGDLCAALDGPSLDDHGCASFVAAARSLFALLTEDLGQIHSVWMRYRRGEPAEHLVLYRSAIRAARHAMKQLAIRPEVDGLLRAAKQQPQLRRACLAIDVALTTQIEIDPDDVLFMAGEAAAPRAGDNAMT